MKKIFNIFLILILFSFSFLFLNDKPIIAETTNEQVEEDDDIYVTLKGEFTGDMVESDGSGGYVTKKFNASGSSTDGGIGKGKSFTVNYYIKENLGFSYIMFGFECDTTYFSITNVTVSSMDGLFISDGIEYNKGFFVGDSFLVGTDEYGTTIETKFSSLESVFISVTYECIKSVDVASYQYFGLTGDVYNIKSSLAEEVYKLETEELKLTCKGDPSITINSGQTVPYTASAANIVNSDEDSEDSIEYYHEYDSSIETITLYKLVSGSYEEVSECVDIGTYKLKVEIDESDVTNSGYKEETFEIVKAKIYIKALGISKEYGSCSSDDLATIDYSYGVSSSSLDNTLYGSDAVELTLDVYSYDNTLKKYSKIELNENTPLGVYYVIYDCEDDKYEVDNSDGYHCLYVVSKKITSVSASNLEKIYDGGSSLPSNEITVLDSNSNDVDSLTTNQSYVTLSDPLKIDKFDANNNKYKLLEVTGSIIINYELSLDNIYCKLGSLNDAKIDNTSVDAYTVFKIDTSKFGYVDINPGSKYLILVSSVDLDSDLDSYSINSKDIYLYYQTDSDDDELYVDVNSKDSLSSVDTCLVIYDVESDDTYMASYGITYLAIKKRPITVLVDDYETTFGTIDDEYEVISYLTSDDTKDGFVNGEEDIIIFNYKNYKKTVVSSEDVYTEITLSNLSDAGTYYVELDVKESDNTSIEFSNYDITYVKGIHTINKYDLTVDINVSVSYGVSGDSFSSIILTNNNFKDRYVTFTLLEDDMLSNYTSYKNFDYSSYITNKTTGGYTGTLVVGTYGDLLDVSTLSDALGLVLTNYNVSIGDNVVNVNKAKLSITFDYSVTGKVTIGIDETGIKNNDSVNITYSFKNSNGDVLGATFSDNILTPSTSDIFTISGTSDNSNYEVEESSTKNSLLIKFNYSSYMETGFDSDKALNKPDDYYIFSSQTIAEPSLDPSYSDATYIFGEYRKSNNNEFTFGTINSESDVNIYIYYYYYKVKIALMIEDYSTKEKSYYKYESNELTKVNEAYYNEFALDDALPDIPSIDMFKSYGWLIDELDYIRYNATDDLNHETLYCTYVFDIGMGDVNGDKKVNINDIITYRQYVLYSSQFNIYTSTKDIYDLVKDGSTFDSTNVFLKIEEVSDVTFDYYKKSGAYGLDDVIVIKEAMVTGYNYSIKNNYICSNDSIVVDSINIYNINDLEFYSNKAMKLVLMNNVSSTNNLTIRRMGSINIDLNGYSISCKGITINILDNDSNLTVTSDNANSKIESTEFGTKIVVPFGVIKNTSVLYISKNSDDTYIKEKEN